MEKLLAGVGSLLYGMRFTMLFFYVGLVAIIFGILGKFLLETYKLMTTLLHELERTGSRYGLQTMCEGGGQVNVTIIERL